MQVRDLVEHPALKVRLHVPGDLGRRLRWVHCVEVSTPGRFLRGGEAVLTTGMWRAAGTEPAEFVAELVRAGVAAVGYGLVPHGEPAPEAMVAAAERASLTCFTVPVEVPFVQIVEMFVAAKRAEWERPLREHLSQYDRIVAGLRAQRGVATVLRVLSAQLGFGVAVRTSGQVVTAAGPGGEEAGLRYAVALVGEGLADAHLLLPRPLGELDVQQQAALAQAMPFLALETERESAVRAAGLRYAAELFDWAWAGAAYLPSVEARLRSVGLLTEGPLAGILVRGDGAEGLAARLSAALGTLGVAAVRGRDVVALAHVRGDAGACAAGLHRALGRDTVLGMGRPGSAHEVRASLVQAQHAANTVTARTGSGWMTQEELDSPLLLFASQDPELVQAACRALLAPVQAQDAEHGSALVESLVVFLDRGGRWQEAAGHLHVHVNTLRHRIARIEELTGRSLSRTKDRVDFYLALQSLGQL